MIPKLDRLSLLLGWIVGIIFGLLIAYVLVIYGIEAIGTAFQIQNMNVTIDINETAIIEAQKAMRGIP